MNPMKISINTPDSLAKQVRDLAHREHTTLRSLVIQGLRRILEERSKTLAQYELADHSCGEGGLVAGLRPGDWGSILERLYEGRGA